MTQVQLKPETWYLLISSKPLLYIQKNAFDLYKEKKIQQRNPGLLGKTIHILRGTRNTSKLLVIITSSISLR